jgi:hypothetical protein
MSGWYVSIVRLDSAVRMRDTRMYATIWVEKDGGSCLTLIHNLCLYNPIKESINKLCSDISVSRSVTDKVAC